MSRTQLFIDGRWVDGERTFAVIDKFTRQAVAEVALPSRAQVAAAVAAVQQGWERAALSPHERGAVLDRTAELIAAKRADFLEVIVAESGFTRPDAENEINRAAQTLKISGEEARRLAGEMIPLSGAPQQASRLGFTIRVPLGVVCAITPFNAPLNTVVHKVGPALAGGNAVVLKPSAYTPQTSAMLVECLLEAGLPPQLIALLQGPGETVGDWLLDEQAIRFYTFTGSTEVGRRLASRAGLRRTQLELGSIASTILCADADLDRALPRVVAASFRKAGQVCTSIQRLFLHQAIAGKFEQALVAEVAKLGVGDPRAPGTVVGPMIDPREAERVELWVKEAVAGGARLLAGGTRNGPVLAPTILADIPAGARVVTQEIFGPVLCLVRFDDLDEAVRQVNATPYGLATGIFTNDLQAAFRAAQRLDVGGVHINETCSSRVDLMPYGGTKDSGFGREGPKYSIREMTEERLITISL